MPTCPKCQQLVDPQAVECPYCKEKLKAFGHPGIPLYRSQDTEYLCSTCIYHEDDSCTFPQRPYARECTLYRDRWQTTVETTPDAYRRSQGMRGWLRRNQGLVALLAILLLVFLVTLLQGS